MNIDDTYGRLGFVRQWSLDAAGLPACVADGLLPTDAGCVAALQRNAAVRALVAAVEAYEAAQRIAQPADDVPRMIDDGHGGQVANPPWAAYDAAQAVIAGVSDATKAHALWCAGEPADHDGADWTAWDAARTATQAALETAAAQPLVSDPRPVPATISDRQFGQQLAAQGIITQDEALAFVATGTIPSALNALIAALPGDQQFPAKMLVAGATSYEFDHPLTAVLAAAFGWSDAQRAAFWRAAALL